MAVVASRSSEKKSFRYCVHLKVVVLTIDPAKDLMKNYRGNCNFILEIGYGVTYFSTSEILMIEKNLLADQIDFEVYFSNISYMALSGATYLLELVQDQN